MLHGYYMLSPNLFVFLLDYALKATLQADVGFVACKRNGSRHTAIHISAFAYVDDICFLAESLCDVECSLHRLESYAAEIGLSINHNKNHGDAPRASRILRYALGVNFPEYISNAELTRWTGATALSNPLRQGKLILVGYDLRMANPSPLATLLSFLQPGHRRRCGQPRSLTLLHNIIDDIYAINHSVICIASATMSYFNLIVATLT